MEGQAYKEISPALLEQAYSNARSIESMATYGMESNSAEYVGSTYKGNIVYDYYRDKAGGWWYKTRGIIDGRIVEMEVYIFGRDIKKERAKKWNKNA